MLLVSDTTFVLRKNGVFKLVMLLYMFFVVMNTNISQECYCRYEDRDKHYR